MITKETKIDQITVTENGIILVREVIRYLDENVEVSSTFHRTSHSPSNDTSNLPEKVKVIADVVWTQEVIDNFNQQSNA